MTHIVAYLAAAQQGEPAWLAAYTQFWIDIITAIGPLLFGVLAAVLEGLIAWSLLAGQWLRVFLPIGLVYSFLIWSTAEGFGGPYTSAGQTGMPGNIFGNAIIYMLVFAYLMGISRWPRKLEPIA